MSQIKLACNICVYICAVDVCNTGPVSRAHAHTPRMIYSSVMVQEDPTPGPPDSFVSVKLKDRAPDALREGRNLAYKPPGAFS